MSQRYVPKQTNIVSSADEIGALLDLSRIEGESLPEYKKRLLSNSKHPSNSTYDGLINSLNRELGLGRSKPIKIHLKPLAILTPKNITVTKDTIKDDRQFQFIVDGSSVIAVGDEIIFPKNPSLIENEMVGMTVFIDSQKHTVLSNSKENIIINGNMSNLVGKTITIKNSWANDALVGLALETDNNKFRITKNTENTLQVDSESMEKAAAEKYIVVANNPRVQIDSCRILLYKDYVNEENYQLDAEILLRNKGKSHLNIIDEVNSSRFFYAENMADYRVQIEAFSIKKQDSDILVYGEEVPATKYFQLKNKNIKEGSLRFSETDIFFVETREVGSCPYGSYYQINYKDGIVQSKAIPSGRGVVSYTYSKMPFEIEAVEAIVTPFENEDSQLFLFTQKQKERYTDPRDKQESSQPRSDMIEYIAELLENSKQTWGK